jgi:hypothetical protein
MGNCCSDGNSEKPPPRAGDTTTSYQRLDDDGAAHPPQTTGGAPASQAPQAHTLRAGDGCIIFTEYMHACMSFFYISVSVFVWR